MPLNPSPRTCSGVLRAKRADVHIRAATSPPGEPPEQVRGDGVDKVVLRWRRADRFYICRKELPLRLAFIALLAAALVAPATAAPAPKVAATSFAQLPTPLPLPYDETADAKAGVAAAGARAKAAHKLLLIDLGGNWCLDCRLLAGTMALPDLRSFLAKQYEVVTVDVGRFDKNLDIAAHYGLKDHFGGGVPSVLIVDPRTDRLRNPGRTAALADARSLSPQALADWLASWTK